MNQLRSGTSLAVCAAVLGLAGPLAAQQTPTPPVVVATNPDAADSATPEERAAGDPIVVTGSRLATGFAAPTPVTVIGAERLNQRGSANIADILNEVPAFRPSNTPASGELRPTAGYVGGRILDLRGLGAVRTLTLIDGKRFVPSTTEGTVDTNMVPSILLDRAEVVTGGASAQYGSDAVAGVANLILNHRLTGIRATAQQSLTRYGDGSDSTLAVAGGISLGDRVRIVGGVEYEHNGGIGDCQVRAFCRTEFINVGRNKGVTSIPANNILGGVHPSTVPFNGVTVPASTAYDGRLTPLLRPFDGITFNDDGTPRRFQYGSLVNNLWMQGGEGAGETIYFKDFLFYSPLQRVAVTGNIDFDLTDDITASLTVNYGHLDSRYNSTIYRNTALTIKATNPFIPRSADPTLDLRTLLSASGATTFQLGKGYAELGPVPINNTNDVYRIVPSIQGKLGSWTWDLAYEYGKNKFRSVVSNNTITARILRAIDAVATPSGPQCFVNTDPITTNDDPACVAFNPFGKQSSAAARAYVVGTAVQTTDTTENDVAANLRGDLFKLPYGEIAVAVGAEYRSVNLAGTADPLSQQLAFFGLNASQLSGEIKVTEGYAEANLPLLADLPFVNELSLNGAIRRTHYERQGGTAAKSTVDATTWKYGAVFEPTDFIRFRATQSRDIRAPNVTELFGPNTRTQGILNDPFRSGQQTNPSVTGGSNANLNPEKADTFTAGVVLTPHNGFFGRFRASADYYQIKIAQAIATLGQQNIANRCYAGETFACGLITRDSTGQISQVDDVLQNVNQLITKGIDFELDYRQPLGSLGGLDARVLANYVKDFITVDSVGPVDRAGQTGLRGGFPGGPPKWTFDGMLTWTLDGFSFNTHVRYIDKGFYNSAFIGPDDPNFSLTGTNGGFSSNLNTVPSRTYVDLLATYRLDLAGERSAVVFAGADNVFNTTPPLNPGSHGTGNTLLFSPAGTTFKIGTRLAY
ncbi:MAG: TonB-dependent receptor [Croceibacterium sp.]